jgi:hypothetical protein
LLRLKQHPDSGILRYPAIPGNSGRLTFFPQKKY